jgi:hypothetical protein
VFLSLRAERVPRLQDTEYTREWPDVVTCIYVCMETRAQPHVKAKTANGFRFDSPALPANVRAYRSITLYIRRQ